ncbi:alpha-glucan family phosphorylase [Epidermidibacterium keratini]|uniref:glycogen phosphorylase n=1 Tax=Epidermidibacterium keratini TaxID=1891644 RepID=A0A7L4YR81_9ACTN|nr:alpha-glucan family phosphorylase [Epidermidibacterium keratini]QHC01751.1 alpha-glucan family phosphorylase [Epidermidibacterium keratini]
MKAIAQFVVRVSLPPELTDLQHLMRNLRWSWHRPTRDLFAAIDQQAWDRVRHNPVELLAAVTAERLEQLRRDDAFLQRLADARRDLDDYLASGGWYAEQLAAGEQLPQAIAYFSPEFGITEALPQYSGGLGILAGDHLKAASDLGVPVLGVGLFYHSGYFSQGLAADGWQLESYPDLHPRLLLRRLRDAGGDPVLISLDLPGGRTLWAQVLIVEVGRVSLLLLDTNVPANTDEALRRTTDRLYGGGPEQRIAQELLLGVGGVRAIRAYCAVTGSPQPEVYHTNEGHAGFQGLERIRELTTGEGLDFDAALQVVRAGTVFTTHTPVPAGIDRFEKSLAARFLTEDRALPGVPLDRILELGSESDPAMFNMAHLGFRLGQRSNGVSRLHGQVSREMFASLWPGFPLDEVPIGSVTNGVHAPTWVGRHMLADGLASDLPDDELWQRRNLSRAALVEEIRRRTRESLLARGRSPAEIGWVDAMFDPDVLTVGFARRVPSYKRLTLMLRDPERLRAILLHPTRPVQIVLAGKSHPADDGGKELIKAMVQFADDPAVRHRITFLPDYDMAMARFLYAGCDVWLNNPLRPLEACGTSGMKSALNGGLNLSIRDGWWDEMYDGENGWAIPTADGVEDPARRDELEAAALYQLLESAVTPDFYERDAAGNPPRWLRRVRHTLRDLGPKVDATRMLRDYLRDLYAPAARSGEVLRRDEYAAATGLADAITRIRNAWPNVAVRSVEVAGDRQPGDEEPVALGTALTVRAVVDLGGLDASDVRVETAVGRPSADGSLEDVDYVPMSVVPGDLATYEAQIDLDRQGPMGYTVRVTPRHEALTGPAELGLLVTA